MTSSAKGDSEFDLGIFFERHRKTILTAGAVLAVGVVSVWSWTASAERKAVRSEQALMSAQQAFYSGNTQLAATDLQRVVDRYGGTPAGGRAAILLAKIRYDESKPAEGVAILRATIGKSGSKAFRPAINALIAQGLEAQGKFDSAATAFRAAAAAERLDIAREHYQAMAARALASAGNKSEALRIWEAIAAREASPYAPEAKLRVAELKATALGT
jgi:predicted negative regulator of RcsB-dependent stress response